MTHTKFTKEGHAVRPEFMFQRQEVVHAYVEGGFSGDILPMNPEAIMAAERIDQMLLVNTRHNNPVLPEIK